MEIPKRLQLDEINFVLLKEKEKKPFQDAWQTKKIKFNDEKLINHLSSNGNYGVMGGGERNLVMIDFDNEELQQKLIDKLPKTFTVKTGSGLCHLYYFSNNAKSFKIFDEELNTLADVQGEGKQVVGAGSIHPNGKTYELIEDVPIAFIDYAELQAQLMPYDKKPKKKVKVRQEYLPKFDIEENFVEECQSQISIADVLNLIGIDTSKNPTECPFHSSKGGKCLGFEDDYAHCFHCDESWNIFSLVKQWKNCDFKEALEILADKFGMKDKLEQSRKRYVKKLREEDAKELQKVITNYLGMKDLAKKILEVQPLYYDGAKLWWIWNKRKFRWEIIDETDVLIMVDSVALVNTVKTKERVEILEALKQGARLNKPKEIEMTWIQFKNIVFDIKTGKQFEATPEYFATNPLPYQLHPEKYELTPTMDRIFEEWVGEDYVKTLYEILAFCMLSDYPINRLFCFIGAGMNGKSKFLELLQKFIGIENVCTTELDILMSSRFEITKLYKKLVCQMGETNFNEMSQTSKLKKLTGGDLIGFEYKNKLPFEARNYAKILIATNSLPTTADKTLGFYRRWMIIDFPNRFSEKKDILKDIPEEEYESLSLKCTTILHNLLEKREFHKEGSPEDRMARYEAKSDFLQDFLEEFVVQEVEGYITKRDFYIKFSSWCDEKKHRKLAENTVGKKMRDKGYESVRRSFDWLNDGRGGRILIWEGIKWKE